MKIFRFSEPTSLILNAIENKLELNSLDGFRSIIAVNTIKIFDYGERVLADFVEVGGEHYRLEAKNRKTFLNRRSSEASSSIRFVNRDTKELDLPDKLHSILIGCKDKKIDGGFFGVVGHGENTKLFHVDLINQKLLSIDCDFGFSSNICGYYVSFYKRQKKLVCYNSLLDVVWQADLGFRHKQLRRVSNHHSPTAVEDSFIIDLGGTKEIREEKFVHDDGEERTIRTITSSHLCRYRIETGERVWLTEVQGEIHSYLCSEKRVYLCTSNELICLSSATGEVLRKVDTKCTKVVMTPGHYNMIFLHGEYIYFGHVRDQRFQVYSVDSFKLKQELVFPNGWRISNTAAAQFDQNTQKIYIQMTRYGRGCANSGVLELDPLALSHPIEIEQGPKFTIDVIASKSNPEEKELLISTGENRFDDVLRFAEIHTRDEAYEHGVSISSSFTFTEGFNGVVNFHYKGDAPDCDDVDEKLKIMEERFSAWANEFYLSADRTRDCRLLASWVKAR